MENNKYYKISLIALIIFGVLDKLYSPPAGSALKLLLNLHIYLSLSFIPFVGLKFLKKSINGLGFYLFIALMTYGLVNVLIDFDTVKMFSLFGNPSFGPSFFVPFFLLWGANVKSIYLLHRISLVTVKIGVLIFPILFFLNSSLFTFIFVPTFFLLLNYKYSLAKDKIWIILSFILGAFSFWNNDIRSGLIRIGFCLLIFLLIQTKKKWIFGFTLIVILAIPTVSVYQAIVNKISVFEEIELYGESYNQAGVDTRTFVYLEVLSDLNKSNSILLGKGPTGTYFSDYFYYNAGDSYIRNDIEVAVLHYLLKGGAIYLVIYLLVFLVSIINVFIKPNNNYIISLALFLSSFVLISFIENIPSYSFYQALVWIIVGLCMSKKIKKLSDNQIKSLIQGKNIPKNHLN